MTTQSEQILENNLIKQLQSMKYSFVDIPNENVLIKNLKAQLEKHNKTTFSDKEFKTILNHLSRGNIYDKAQILRDKLHITRNDGQSFYVEFFNNRQWCQNQYQVTRQVSVEGSYRNRYDVTILINGLPLVQIELKRRGEELKKAFNQTQRYQRQSYDSSYGLFQYIQLFVISNGVNTKYYANNKAKSYKFTSYWTDKDNKKIADLGEFTRIFLEPCQVSKMIAKYIVLTSKNELMILRPYQYYAVEAIIDKVTNGQKGGYIWHTTGSGKTLTSFKASQILIDIDSIYKVVFVVDRNDLDTQTIEEFNRFKKDSVDQTDNTSHLVKQFNDPSNKLIVTTIQKLNNAISNQQHLLKMDEHKDKKIIFIFDECHRSQFGETHKKITNYFTNYQLFGFTGTPIFKKNATGNNLGKRTTKDLFGDCLHKYVITDAINDENVLRFLVEYVGKYKLRNTVNELDIEVEAIDVKELMNSEARLEKVVDYILTHHDIKTHSKDFNAIFAVSSVDTLNKYYEIFKRKQKDKERPLKIATIFTYEANGDDNVDDMLDEDIEVESVNKISKSNRDKLESYIADYNKLFGTSYTTKDSKSFYNYYRDIADRVKKRQIDILLVVNMFLTGFDSPTLNTLYVDKNLRYHGLLQAYSRTNRIFDDRKSQGNIVAFRNLKKYTDDSIELFSNKEAEEIIFLEPFETYIAQFNDAVRKLFELTKTPAMVDILYGEEQQLEFVRRFRDVTRLKNILSSFADFDINTTLLNEQFYEDFKSKYLDIYDKVRSDTSKDKASILEDVDFELELIRRDEINVDYILRLLAQMIGATEGKRESITKTILDTLSSEVQLRSKRELIEKFINSYIPKITSSDEVDVQFENFWSEEKNKAIKIFCEDENVNADKLQELINDYIYFGRKPKGDDIIATLNQQPKILERSNIIKRILIKFNNFVDTFIEGI